MSTILNSQICFMAIPFEYPIAYSLNGYFQDLQKDGANTPSAAFKLQRIIDTQPKARGQLIEWGKNNGILQLAEKPATTRNRNGPCSYEIDNRYY
jgi:hypothetical protein